MSASQNNAARRARIAELNDQLRRTQTGGRTVMTLGIQALGPGFIIKAITAMQHFTAFDADNDPHGEHDFGAFEVDGYRLFFKVDYYAPDMQHGSEDPADSEKTTRILTLMLAEEY